MNNHRLASGGYNYPASGDSQSNEVARLDEQLAHLARPFDTAIHECVCRLIKGARNCEHASNIADDRDIEMSFFTFERRYPAGNERKFYRLKVYRAINRDQRMLMKN